MSTPYARQSWVDGPWGVARPVSLPEFSSPIPGVATEYVLRQRWSQFRNNFSALALNTAHPDYADFLLVEEGPRREVGGGLVEWDRLYAKIPATHSEWESFGYSFIGYLWQVSGVNIRRTRPQWSVTSRIQYDYFICNGTAQSDPILGTTPTITTPGDIPKIWQQQYVGQAVINGATYGGILFATDILNPSGSTEPTWPTSDNYQVMVSGALASGWSSPVSKVVLYNDNTLSGGTPPTTGHIIGAIDTGSSTLGGQIAAEDSRLDRWMGNIWMRRTRFVLAA